MGASAHLQNFVLEFFSTGCPWFDGEDGEEEDEEEDAEEDDVPVLLLAELLFRITFSLALPSADQSVYMPHPTSERHLLSRIYFKSIVLRSGCLDKTRATPP